MKKKHFGELAVGTRFVYRGRSFVKIARSMAEDDERLGTIFMDQVEVEVEDTGERDPATGANPS